MTNETQPFDRVEFEAEAHWMPDRPVKNPGGFSKAKGDSFDAAVAKIERAKEVGPLCHAVIRRIDSVITEVYRETWPIPEEYSADLWPWFQDEMSKEPIEPDPDRLAARQPAPVVGDEELLDLFRREGQCWIEGKSGGMVPGDFDPILGIRAVRDAILAAQAVQVPDDLKLPDGWLVDVIERVEFEDHAYYHAQIYGPGDLDEAEGEGPEPWDALRDAIAQAKGGQE